MKDKAANQSWWLKFTSWVCYGVAALSALALLIPGVNVIAAISLTTVSVIGAGCFIACQEKAKEVDRHVAKVDAKIS